MTVDAIHRLEKCVAEIDEWMVRNKLKLNGDKTDILFSGTACLLKQLDVSFVRIGEAHVTPSACVRNLGVMFDSGLTMEQQVKAVCRSCGPHIRNIGKIRQFLTPRAIEQLVHSFITTRLDACNSLLYGIPDTLINQLQQIQHTAARLVSGTRKYEHITPVMKSLHWLPIRERIDFKVLLLTFKALHGLAPSYLTELIETYTPARSLRSQSKHLLLVPHTRLKSFGDRAFAKAAPVLWNSLPLHIRTCDSLPSFKSLLKTYLFQRAYT